MASLVDAVNLSQPQLTIHQPLRACPNVTIIVCGSRWSTKSRQPHAIPIARAVTSNIGASSSARTPNHRKGTYFYRCDKALQLFGGNRKALSGLSCLPSKSNKEKQEKDKKNIKMQWDTAITKALELRSWKSKKMIAIMHCYYYNKPYCQFSCVKEGLPFSSGQKKLKQRLEAMSHMCSFDDLMFRDDEPFGKIIIQHQNITCEIRVEKATATPMKELSKQKMFAFTVVMEAQTSLSFVRLS